MLLPFHFLKIMILNKNNFNLFLSIECFHFTAFKMYD